MQGLGAFALAYVVYLLGRSAYFSEKEAEHSRQRYLDNGVDLMAANVDYALSVHRHNWALFYRYLKLYRDSVVPVNLSGFFEEFLELDQSRFQVPPAHRVQAIVADDVIWVAYQKVFSFVTTRNDLMKGDFAETLKNAAEAGADVDKAGVVSEGEKLGEKMNDDSKKFYVFLSRLMDLAAIFERQRLNRQALETFRQRPDVRNIVAGLSDLFRDDASDPAAATDADATTPAETA